MSTGLQEGHRSENSVSSAMAASPQMPRATSQHELFSVPEMSVCASVEHGPAWNGEPRWGSLVLQSRLRSGLAEIPTFLDSSGCNQSTTTFT